MRPLMTVLVILTVAVPAFATDYTITNGYFGTKTISGYDSLIMTGGGGDRLTGKDNSVLDIRNTSPLIPLSGGVWDLIVTDYSHLYFSGGHVNRLDLGSHARAEISGGQINELSSGYIPSTSPWIEIICKDWDYSTTTKILTGTWGDNSTFNMQLSDVAGYTSTYSNIDFTIIPEPATLLLLSLGGLLIRRRK